MLCHLQEWFTIFIFSSFDSKADSLRTLDLRFNLYQLNQHLQLGYVPINFHIHPWLLLGSGEMALVVVRPLRSSVYRSECHI